MFQEIKNQILDRKTNKLMKHNKTKYQLHQQQSVYHQSNIAHEMNQENLANQNLFDQWFHSKLFQIYYY